MTPWLLVLLSTAPVDARFVLEVGGLPVAELRVALRDDTWAYEATHFLDEGPRVRRVTRSLAEGTPEVLAFLTPPAAGCQTVIEERTGKREKLCVARREPDLVTGTLDASPFTARYAAGRLREIVVGPARWRAVTQAARPPAESPFSRGVPVPPGRVTLTPAFEGAVWLSRSPVGVATAAEAGRVRCLLSARNYVERHPTARVSVGLVLEGGRAFPHAWVSDGERLLDPSVPAGDPALKARRYLEVPIDRSGAFFLALFEGDLRLEAAPP